MPAAFDIAVDVVIVLLSILALWKGAEWVVESASRIGKRFGMSDLVIGLTIVAFGTSAPEFAVTVAAALRGQGDISVGNVVGSNIFNLGFVLGGVAAVRAISTSKTLVFRDGLVLIGITVLLRLFVNDLNISNLEGATLIALLLVYMGYLLWKREALHAEEVAAGEATWRDGLKLLAGLALIVGGGHYLVESASALARIFGVSEWVIGVTIVAAGTSAPELATSMVAVLRGRHGISIGNLVGSDIFNLLGVLGVATLLNPVMTVDPHARISIMILTIMVTVVVIFMRTGWRISRAEGIFLVVVNLIRWWADFSR
ncbi:MAG: sodium:calcium antiporter [Anaerolineae bacterium]